MVRFPFRIGKSFLDYHWHPITIPKRHYGALEQEKLTERPLTIESPFGVMQGEIVYARAGYGPYYQIQMGGRPTGDCMAKFKLGEQISVELERVGNAIRVTLQPA